MYNICIYRACSKPVKITSSKQVQSTNNIKTHTINKKTHIQTYKHASHTTAQKTKHTKSYNINNISKTTKLHKTQKSNKNQQPYKPLYAYI